MSQELTNIGWSTVSMASTEQGGKMRTSATAKLYQSMEVTENYSVLNGTSKESVNEGNITVAL